MATGLASVVYAALLVPTAAAVWLRPARALYLFVVGLAAHNAVMAALYGAGVRGGALTSIQAWKEILLAVALARVARDAWSARRWPIEPRAADWLALAFGALVVLYAVLPQSALGGGAGTRGIALALRHDLVPVAAFLLGRSLGLGLADLRRLAWTFLGAAAAVAAIGLVDVYAVPIGWWRESSVPAYFRHLGYDYHGTGRLPENFIYNTGSEAHFLRRLVSLYLSPLAASYMLVLALLAAAAGRSLLRPRRLTLALAVLCGAGLLYTFSRASLLALAAGLVVLALARRRLWPVLAAAATVAVAVAWASIFPSIAPQGHWTRADLAYQRAHARAVGAVKGGALSSGEPSIHSHLASLRAGLRSVLHHPQGYGLGNAGTVAARTDVPLKAGESNYTEIGVETGVAGALAFVGWNLALLASLLRAARRGSAPEARRAAAAIGASLAAVLALAVQTDTLGDPWLGYCLWWLGGALLSPAAMRAPATEAAMQPSTRAVAPPAEARP